MECKWGDASLVLLNAVPGQCCGASAGGGLAVANNMSEEDRACTGVY